MIEWPENNENSPQQWGGLSAEALGQQHFPPMSWVVPGILPEGLAILAGKPKFGKSFLALDLAIAIATGGMALRHIQCEAGDVLYLALEDGRRRIRDRLKLLVPFGEDMPSHLFFETAAMRLRSGLERQIDDWLDLHPGARCVIIDTYARVKPEGSGRGSAYDDDAASLAPLHELALGRPGLSVVVIHHTRKLESDDAFETISGTHGLTGIADSLLVLGSHGTGAKLAGQGRDMEGFEKALTRDEFSGGWRLEGDARALAKTGERQALLDVLTEADGEVLTTSRIAKAAGVSESSASHRLKALVAEGLASKPNYGKWTLAKPPSKSSKSLNYGPAAKPSDGDFDEIDEFDGGLG
jgi:hypothetical protein